MAEKMNTEIFVEYMINNRFSVINFNRLKYILQQSGAIIAGGSVLASYINGRINDIDIYVNLNNAQKFLALLNSGTFITKYSNSYLSSPYDRSFLFRNNIIGRLNLVSKFPSDFILDIMIVNDNVPVTDVPKNFDLTFTMIWYDGYDVFAMHPEDIQKKEGMLCKHYFKALLEGNTFTLNRIEKYKKKGFTIKFPSIDVKDIEFKKYKKEVISSDIWLTTKLIEILIGKQQQQIWVNDIKVYSTVLFLNLMKKLQTQNNSETLLNYNNFKEMFGILYGKKISDFNNEIEEEEEEEGWVNSDHITINIVISYILYSRCCLNWSELDEEWKDKIKNVSGIDYVHEHWIYTETVADIEHSRPNYRELIIEKAQTFFLTNDDLKLDMIRIYKELYPPTPMERFQEAQRKMKEAADESKRKEGDHTDQELEIEENYKIPNTETIVPGGCFHERSFRGDKRANTSSWYLADTENILFLVDYGGDDELICISLEELKKIIGPDPFYENQILYKCKINKSDIVFLKNEDGTETRIKIRDLPTEGIVRYDLSLDKVDLSTAYIPLGVSIEHKGENVFITEKDILRIIRIVSNDPEYIRLFTLKFSDTIPFTTAKRNTDYGTIGHDYVSINHCQFGSSITLFKVVEFEDEDDDDDEDEDEDVDDDEDDDDEDEDEEDDWFSTWQQHFETNETAEATQHEEVAQVHQGTSTPTTSMIGMGEYINMQNRTDIDEEVPLWF